MWRGRAVGCLKGQPAPRGQPPLPPLPLPRRKSGQGVAARLTLTCRKAHAGSTHAPCKKALHTWAGCVWGLSAEGEGAGARDAGAK